MLLISFANFPSPKPPVYSYGDEGGITPLDMTPTHSAAGMAANDKRMWVVTADDQLAEIDLATRAETSRTHLAAPRAHSIAVTDDHLYVAATGRDEIRRRPLHGPDGWETVWSPDGATGNDDRYHVNSITIHDGELYASAFGPRGRDGWSDAKRGYIANVTTGVLHADDLHQPHSLLSWRGELWWCESGAGLVSYRGDSYLVGGYPRGLAPLGAHDLAVATSSTRNSPGADGCAIHRLDVDTGIVTTLAELDHIGPEVYGLWSPDGGA